MPLYDYKCTACGNRYEKREGFDAPARHPCPKCGEPAKRVLHPPPIVFKGSGFYITDSRKGSQATLGESPSTGGGGVGNGSKTEETKPAAESKSDPAPSSTTSNDSKSD